MSTGNQQGHARGHRTVFERVDGNVTTEVIDRVEGHTPRSRIRFGSSDADQQGARETRTDRHRYRVRAVDIGGSQCTPHRRHDRFEMCTRGHLGHYTAVPCVFVDAGRDLVGE